MRIFFFTFLTYPHTDMYVPVFFSFTLSNDTSGAYISSWLYSTVTFGTS